MPQAHGRLFQPMKIGPIELSSRIVLGPICSNLADENNVLASEAKDYYGQRGQVPGTFLIGEATFINPEASGTTEPRAGIFTKAQIDSWKSVVDSVHAAGSYIFLQLWVLGRQANAERKKKDGTGDVVSASNIPEEGGAVPRELTEDEIWKYIQDHGKAARTAVETCGFDGVELHGGNGSLIDQFTQDVSNKRNDSWGGSVENRSRFGLEITKAVCEAIGSERVGYRISPWSTYSSMGMKDAIPQFSHLLQGLRDLNIAYVHLVESRIAGRVDVEDGESLDPFINVWGNAGPIILAGGFSPESAQTAVDKDYKHKNVAIAFGRAFVTNADLVKKLRDGEKLAEG